MRCDESYNLDWWMTIRCQPSMNNIVENQERQMCFRFITSMIFLVFEMMRLLEKLSCPLRAYLSKQWRYDIAKKQSFIDFLSTHFCILLDMIMKMTRIILLCCQKSVQLSASSMRSTNFLLRYNRYEMTKQG